MWGRWVLFNPLCIVSPDKTFGEANKIYNAYQPCSLCLAWIFPSRYSSVIGHCCCWLPFYLFVVWCWHNSVDAAKKNYGAVVSLWAPVVLVCLIISFLISNIHYLAQLLFDSYLVHGEVSHVIFQVLCRFILWTLKFGMLFTQPCMVVLLGPLIVLER